MISKWSTWFVRAQGDTTRKGMRVPGPQRPFTGLPATPASGVPVPHAPGPFSWSASASNEAELGVR